MIINKKYLEENHFPYYLQSFFEVVHRGEDCELEDFLKTILEHKNEEKIHWLVLLFDECKKEEKDLIVETVLRYGLYSDELKKFAKALPRPYNIKIKSSIVCDECGRCCDC